MGLGGMKYAWQRQTKDFAHTQADKYSVLTLDNRGIGESDKPFFRYSTSEMAKDVIEVMDHVGWNGKRECHVVGISMGGMIAQEIVSPFLITNIRHLLRSCFSDGTLLDKLGTRIQEIRSRKWEWLWFDLRRL
jgi:pimeloyl-ACP methyl ester carboxylesterase